MIQSMTGFGVGASHQGPRRADVTMRTLNHRYLSLRLRSLADRPFLQARVEETLRQAFSRGEVDVWVMLDLGGADDRSALFDQARIGRYLEELRRLSRTFDLAAPALGDLARLGVLEPAPLPEEDLWGLIEPALAQAISATQSARATEGALLCGELTEILGNLACLAGRIQERVPELRLALRDRLFERIAALELDVDPTRLETEVALLADRSDVEEEITRLGAHLARAQSLLERDGPVGKELDFLSQELLREVNTLGAKARDLEVGSLVLDMKVAIEQFKEQVQNVE